MRDVLDKYFKDERVMHYNTADLIQAEHFIRYEYRGGKVIISVGSDDGEIEIFVCTDAEDLEKRINSIIH